MSMEEIKSLVPFEGQVQCPSPEDDLLWLLDYFSSNPDIDQLLQLQQVEPNSVSIAESTNESAGPLDPLDGELVWGNPDYPGIAGDNSDLLVDPMDFNLEPIKPEDKLSEFLGTGYENTIPVSIRPQPWVPLSCSCCQVIRDIRHTNGTEATRLEIHGRVGVICHAILEIQDGVAPNTQYHMTDFSKQTMESVKQFLMQYCKERREAGFVMLQDPLSDFYDALSAGQNWDEEASLDELTQPCQNESEVSEMINSNAESSGTRPTRSSLALQRERTGKLQLRDLTGYFHLPIEVAAKELSICPTVLKKICRKNGMLRWPHRKIRSMDRKISSLQQQLAGKNGEDSHARSELEKLRQERARIYASAVK